MTVFRYKRLIAGNPNRLTIGCLSIMWGIHESLSSYGYWGAKTRTLDLVLSGISGAKYDGFKKDLLALN